MVRFIEKIGRIFGGRLALPERPPDMGTLMAGATLSSRQRWVSWPKVRRFAEMVRHGEIPPEISVDDGLIVEGHHRYVAGVLARKLPGQRPGRLSGAREVIPWAEVGFDLEDWGGD